MAASHIPLIASTNNEQTARHAKAPIEPRSLLRRYGAAGLCVGGAVLLRWILDPALGPLLPLSTTFGFVALAVWYGGWGPGAFTALAGYLAVKWLFIEPRLAFSIGVQDLWGFAAYLSSVAVIIAIGDAMRRAGRAADVSAAAAIQRQRDLEAEAAERKIAEAALRESEARFRTMADAAPVLIWTSGPDKLCGYFNEGWLDFTGRTMEQEVGNGWAEGVHPGDVDRRLTTYVEAFDKRVPFEMEYRLCRSDGEYRWMLDRGVPRFGSDGNFLGYIGSCIDIADRKNAQEALRESEQRLSGIISSAMDAIITIDETQPITDFNNSAERMFGCAASDAIGRSIDRFIPERFRAMHAQHIQAFGHTRVTKRQMGALGTIYGRRANGAEFPIEASISQLRTRTGKFYTVILRDVTERKQAEEALRASEARYRDLIHALPAAVYTCDDKGRVTLHNQAAAALWGREPEVGKDLW